MDSRAPSPLILFPDQAMAAPESVIGGKAQGLARLVQHGASVPAWCVLKVNAFQDHLAHLDQVDGFNRAIADLQQVVEAQPGEAGSQHPLQDELTTGSAAVRDTIVAAPVSTELRTEIDWALDQLGQTASGYAIRSSMVGEDSKTFSFAGQLASFLFVHKTDEVVDSIRNCWASAYSRSALLYRARVGLGVTSLQVAVVIQSMVEGQISGVTFTAHPVTGMQDQSLITAAWGLGEGVVNGLCNTDEYLWSHQGRELDARLADKDCQTVRAPVSGTRESTVAKTMRFSRCLSTAQVAEIGQVTLAIAQALGAPQDIEWTLQADKLWILQSRPITTLAAPKHRDGPRIVFDNCNIQESYCGVTTPLTFSFAAAAYAEVYAQLMRVLGLPEQTIRNSRPILNNLLGLVAGRIYYNLNNWYRGLCFLPSFGRNKADMESMMGVQEPVDFVMDETLSSLQKIARLPRLINVAVRLQRRFVRLNRDVPRFIAHFNQTAHKIKRQKLTALSFSQLSKNLVFLRRELLGRWETPIVNDFFVMMSLGRLRRMVTRVCPGDANTMVNNLLAGEPNIVSTEPTYALMDIARMISLDSQLANRVSHGSTSQGLQTIQQLSPKIAAAIDRYVERYGDRVIGELKLETITLHEDRGFLVQILRSYLSNPQLDAARLQHRELDRRQTAETDLANRLGWWQRRKMSRVLRAARSSIKHREDMRLARTRMFGLFRAVYRAIGTRLMEIGKISSQEDVFYLTVEEIDAYHEGRAVTTHLGELATLRRHEFATFQAHELPHRFETVGPVYDSPRIVTAQDTDPNAQILFGTGCYPGVVEAKLRVILNPNDDLDVGGQILTTLRTDPGWAPLFPTASGILVERGSSLSHSAVLARELGIPAVVGVPGLLNIVHNGEQVTLDGGTGEIHRQPKEQPK